MINARIPRPSRTRSHLYPLGQPLDQLSSPRCQPTPRGVQRTGGRAQSQGGLDRPTAGSVELGTDSLSKQRDSKLAKIRAKEIGFVFQGFNLIPTLTAQENVETALAPLGVSSAERVTERMRGIR